MANPSPVSAGNDFWGLVTTRYDADFLYQKETMRKERENVPFDVRKVRTANTVDAMCLD